MAVQEMDIEQQSISCKIPGRRFQGQWQAMVVKALVDSKFSTSFLNTPFSSVCEVGG